MAVHVGTAPDSWGVWFASDERQTPWQRFLDEVVLAGYGAIELGPFGYLPTHPERVASELRQRALRLSGGMVMGDLDTADSWDTLRPSVAQVCEVLRRTDARYLIVLDQGYTDFHTGATIGSRDLDERGWACVRETLHRLGEYTAARGIVAAFHPHADTTVQYEAQIERLLELTDPALVSLCLDVGHHTYAGGDAVAFFRQHRSRIAYLHLKDVDASICERARREGRSFTQAVSQGAFVELGQGAVDLGGLRRAAEDADFEGWGIVEQDMYPAPFDKPLPIARRNRAFLRATGIG